MKFDNVMQTFGDELKPFAPKIYIVNCPKCGAALKVKDGAAVYACGACNYLFQIRKIAQDVTEAKEKEESLEMQTPEAENTAEEPCDESAETPVEAEESKEEEIEWNPTIDEEDSEDGWEEDNRQIDMPVWQEEEAEEGWDEE